MIGLEFEQPIKEIRHNSYLKSISLLECSGTNVIRLLPPLSLTMDNAKQFLNSLDELL